MEWVEFLSKQVALFSEVPKEILLHDILPQGQIQDLAKNQFIVTPQQVVNRFGIVLAGKINIIHFLADGRYSLMSTLLPSDLFGMDLICTKSRVSPYHAVAAEQTKIISFPATLLTGPGGIPEIHRQQLITNSLTHISNENLKKEYRLAILAQKGIRERIITYLTMQASKRGSRTIVIPFTREELAAFLCVNRAALSHELSLMQQDGLISFRKNIFTIHIPPTSMVEQP